MPNDGSTRASAITGTGALDVRNDDLAADRIAIARVVGMHGHRDVAEDRCGAHGRDHDAVASVSVDERVARRT